MLSLSYIVVKSPLTFRAAINEISSELICQVALSPLFNVKWKAQFEIWQFSRKFMELKFRSILAIETWVWNTAPHLSS